MLHTVDTPTCELQTILLRALLGALACLAAAPNMAAALHDRPVDVLSDGHVVQYSRARYYAPAHSRWLQRDPTGYTDGGNLYEAFAKWESRCEC